MIPIRPGGGVKDSVNDNVCRSVDTTDSSDCKSSKRLGLVSPARGGKRPKKGCPGDEIGCIFKNQASHVSHVISLRFLVRKARLDGWLEVMKVELDGSISVVDSGSRECRSRINPKCRTQSKRYMLWSFDDEERRR